MPQNAIDILRECTEMSLAGEMAFPMVVMKLAEVGVEFYHVDLLRNENTFYFLNGTSHTEAMSFSGPVIHSVFCRETVQDAIRLAQQGEIKYPEFLKQVMKAGTAYYHVFIQGKKAVYVSRYGESHVEPFPQVKESSQLISAAKK
jgi:uncharacterized protein YbcV (DUF1398 family)